MHLNMFIYDITFKNKLYVKQAECFYIIVALGGAI